MLKSMNTLHESSSATHQELSSLKPKKLSKLFGKAAVSSVETKWKEGRDFTIDPRHANTHFFAEKYINAVGRQTAMSIGEHAVAPIVGESLATDLASHDKYQKPTVIFGEASVSKKEQSDDSFFTGENCAAVCDGVGSSDFGGRASRLVRDTLKEQLPAVNTLTSRAEAEVYLKALLLEMHDLVLQDRDVLRAELAAQGVKNKDTSMNSTVTTLNYIVENGVTYAAVANVGDSPAYVFHKGRVKEITDWHKKDKPKSKYRQALGKDHLTIEPVVKFIKVADSHDKDDVAKEPKIIALTSNGVFKRDENGKKMHAIFNNHNNPQRIANLLASLKGPSSDDSTAIIGKYKKPAANNAKRDFADRNELIAA